MTLSLGVILNLGQALNEDCFDVLLRYFDCRFECFASPLNSRSVILVQTQWTGSVLKMK